MDKHTVIQPIKNDVRGGMAPVPPGYVTVLNYLQVFFYWSRFNLLHHKYI